MIFSSPAKVLIVEDQPHIGRNVEALVKQQPGFIVVGSCGRVQEAIQYILLKAPDIVLLDVSLADGTAFEILEKFPKMLFKIIFLTGSNDYAIRAIKLNAVDYLLKPPDLNELKQALDKAVHASPIPVELVYEALKRSDAQQRIVIRFQNSMQILEFNEILYCHGDTGYTTFFLTNGAKVLSSKHLKDYEEQLPRSWFLRTHQSYIVNHHYISRYMRDEGRLILRDGTEILVSKRRRDIVNDYFKKL